MVRFDDIAGGIKSCAEQMLLHNVYRIMLEMCFNVCTDVNFVVVQLNRVRTDLDYPKVFVFADHLESTDRSK